MYFYVMLFFLQPQRVSVMKSRQKDAPTASRQGIGNNEKGVTIYDEIQLWSFMSKLNGAVRVMIQCQC